MGNERICLYYRVEPERDRWAPGDRFIRPIVRRLVRGKRRLGGVDKVFFNLCLGLDRLGIRYETNIPFKRLRADDRVAVLGRGRHSLQGYDRTNPIVAGIGLMGHPGEWPTLCTDYPVVRYLQHSDWANDVYKPYFGKRCGIWPVGINTHAWTPSAVPKDLDFLFYDKVQWNRERNQRELIQPIKDVLRRRRMKFAEIRYGGYDESDFRGLLSRSKAMIFLSESESQGLAYQECMSSGVPVLAWDQGWWLDPSRFKWGNADVRATSVPYFDDNCGSTFRNLDEFETSLDRFLDRLHLQEFDPRAYILKNLTLEHCSQRFVDILRRDLGTS
ncbi:MAG: glycosyltransferase [Burkholderiales bacterium]|nr:glycosyltransferase [Burkholderiales bacterium]